MTIEKQILSDLASHEEFSRRVLPFIKEEYFSDSADKITFRLINNFIQKHNALPSSKALAIELEGIHGISSTEYDGASDTISAIERSVDPIEFLVEKAEQFCQDKAIYNGIMDAIKILDDKKSNGVSRGMIPKLLSDALAVSFDDNIGHDFIADADARFDFYHAKEERVPFHLAKLNEVTKGGLPRKSLSCAIASTGGGKSMWMCDDAAYKLELGKNVLYITLEMAEERIAERIDANLLDVTLDELAALPKAAYMKKMDRLRERVRGKLIIKEYPTASASSANFRYLINELKLKKNFTPDVIYIDYLNICASARIKLGSNVNSYSYIKAIAEELRGLAIEFNVPIVTATQTNRSGYDNSDIDMTDTSESIGLPMTLDFFFALIPTEELDQLGQIMIKQLKNRFGPIDGKNKRFVVGVDRSRMKFFDVDESQQRNVRSPEEETKGSAQPFGKSGQKRDFGAFKA